MTDEKRCEHCVQYCVTFRTVVAMGEVYEGEQRSCALDRPLIPCEFYEREPGADDE